MNKRIAKNYVLGSLLVTMFIGFGFGITMASAVSLIPFDGLVVSIISLIVMFILQNKYGKAGYEIRIDLKKGGENEQTKT